jgi:cardiolipin synthase (CMP-forming)
LNMACWITTIRFVLAPLIFWQLAIHTTAGMSWMLILLFFSGGSDVLDGWVARVRNEVSELGKALDPLADKFVILATLLGLTWWGLPIWMVVIYLVKETIQVLAGWFLLRRFKQLISANFWGKSATVTFFAGFALFFWHQWVGTMVIALATIISIYALFTYYRVFLKIKAPK